MTRYKIQVNYDRGWEDMHHDGGGEPGDRMEFDTFKQAWSWVDGLYESADAEDLWNGLEYRAVSIKV
tara:strand:+ start:52 stop:252 length:201 start_codon:yes stop_codon:yes gene_type:complete